MNNRKVQQVAVGVSMSLLPVLALAQEADGEPNYITVLAGMLLGLAFLVMVLVMVFTLIARSSRARYETIKLLIEKGQEVPPELLAPHRPAAHRFDRERWSPAELMGHAVGWGVILSCLGVGIGLANYIDSGELRSAAWGLIPLFLGIGWFINAGIIRYQIAKVGKP